VKLGQGQMAINNGVSMAGKVFGTSSYSTSLKSSYVTLCTHSHFFRKLRESPVADDLILGVAQNIAYR
jgi:hypothetical protein